MICQGCEAQMARGFNYVENDGRGKARFLIVGEAPGQTEVGGSCVGLCESWAWRLASMH
jgi:hypothetical protein